MTAPPRPKDGPKVEPDAAETSRPAKALDRIDRRILRILQEDATIPIATIADRVGLSQTPCWKRIRRLELEGVIEKRVALLNPEKLGLGITVFVSLEAPDHSVAWLANFAEQVSAMPEVMELYRMAGDVDYMLRVVVADMASYDVFYKRLISTVSLKSVTSRFAMERIKFETAYAIP
ncbi:Lrp/AsnC family transcriptional regulator [Enterovirga sp.]|uniref:Lrp/AsnC family transcriptional regulator n=1 Tax=Enterovirga sp. TaxID=2026350 RepID=UPI00262852D5|nr:Lrp/AsnC family transcriptional regulator [Enterovirga sp.]MDB5590176.1 transcriptional regulator, AsnC family [Enterovirga sp.]